MSACWQRLGEALLGRLERPLAQVAVPAAPADVIVVLGASCHGGEPGRFAAERARVAAQLFARSLAPVILVSGGKPQAGLSEAAVLARYLERLGVPRAALWLEERSRSTHENAVCSAPILRAHGWTRALLVTQGFHARRARRHFRVLGVRAEVVELVLPDGGETRRRPWRGLYFVLREYLAWARAPLYRNSESRSSAAASSASPAAGK